MNYVYVKKMERLLNKHKEDFVKNKFILNLQSERKVGVVLIVLKEYFL